MEFCSTTHSHTLHPPSTHGMSLTDPILPLTLGVEGRCCTRQWSCLYQPSADREITYPRGYLQLITQYVTCDYDTINENPEVDMNTEQGPKP